MTANAVDDDDDEGSDKDDDVDEVISGEFASNSSILSIVRL
jgi:hypothetical protein